MLSRVSLLAGSIAIGVLMMLDCTRVSAKSLLDIADKTMPVARSIAGVPKDDAYFKRLKRQRQQQYEKVKRAKQKRGDSDVQSEQQWIEDVEQERQRQR